ncbi:ABC transporter substrate-binding protein [Salipiger sp. 1_MG-2023]|uniref:ABC transporter substrate-binding protein n=1 Tax=Salipiger sp. 1_MG-2023 TaxID=3062665 RepID=UPI0026E13A5A|nr:ABC transporter substrate-binding protein [Salipiger sp. 1_MG-2023]MDO6585732.1 ABC transporter substrate-binding protein [Salipiger sp. 1_MG-2023]
MMKNWLLAAVSATLATGAAAQDKVVFATNWLAQGGHGGFYQALADGTYEEFGLDVEIQQGGPQVNNRPMLAAGRIDFLQTGNLLLSFDNVRNGIPTVVVAAYYEKDPQVLIAHEGQYEGWDDLASAPEVLIGKDGQFSFWQWMTASQGFSDEQLRPYGYNLAGFLNDEKMVQQGYATSEPLYAEKQGAPVDTFLLADQGWSTYASTIEARVEMVEDNPDLVQRFIDASTIGWYNYLYNDPSLGNAAIMEANPEMTAEGLAAEVDQLLALGIIGSGLQSELGIGAIDLDRVQAFYDTVVDAGILEEGSVDLSKVATDQFVNHKVGMDLVK